MLKALSRLSAAMLVAAAVGCASKPESFPPSPVPAALNDLEANRLGSAFLAQQNTRHAMLHSALRQSDGYLLAYTTVFDADGKPPKESHLVIVRNDGTVREVKFDDGK